MMDKRYSTIEYDLRTQFVMPLEDLNLLLGIDKNRTVTKVEIVGRGSTVLITTGWFIPQEPKMPVRTKRWWQRGV